MEQEHGLEVCWVAAAATEYDDLVAAIEPKLEIVEGKTGPELGNEGRMNARPDEWTEAWGMAIWVGHINFKTMNRA